MSYNGSGTFNINTTGQPVVAGTIISAATFNALTADLGTGLTTALTKDGQTTATARIPFAAGITSTLVTDASSVSTGSIITAGGVGIAKKLYVGTDANIAGTLVVTGVATFSATPIYSSLTASSAVATDASKALVSVTNTGTGSNVLATTPTITTAALTNPTVTNYVETPYSANSSTAITLSLANGTVQIITLTGTATITMPTAVSGKSFTLLLKQDATGSRTVTWTTVSWPGGTAPTITSTASKMDKYVFISDGTYWYGATAGQNYT
jgi:hypothetical protein